VRRASTVINNDTGLGACDHANRPWRLTAASSGRSVLVRETPR